MFSTVLKGVPKDELKGEPIVLPWSKQNSSKASEESVASDVLFESGKEAKMSSKDKGKPNQAVYFNSEELKKKYALYEIVGKGAYGTVVRGADKRTGKDVAIKVISNVFTSFKQAKSILREIAIMRHISMEAH